MDNNIQAGIHASLPLHLGVVPFGIVTGIAAIEAGLSPEQAIGMSAIVFAGASQLVALELLGETAPLAIVIGTTVIVNLRVVMYSASIAPYFANYSRLVRAGLAFFLVDPVYAVSVAEFGQNESRDRLRYYLGLAGAIWIGWVFGTVVGVVVGRGVPPRLELSFTVPLAFLALLVPMLEDESTVVTAIIGGAGAIAAAGAPFNLGLLIGSLVGICAGLVVEMGEGP